MTSAAGKTRPQRITDHAPPGRLGLHCTALHVHSEMQTNVQSNMRTHVHIEWP